MTQPSSGPEVCEVEVPADTDAIAEQLQGLESFLASAGVPTITAGKLILALDELLVNWATHGQLNSGGEQPSGGHEGRIAVRAEVTAGVVRIDISDPGPPFDPTVHPQPDLNAPLEKRAVGGLGIYLVRTFMDTFTYERRGDRNHVHLRKDFDVST